MVHARLADRRSLGSVCPWEYDVLIYKNVELVPWPYFQRWLDIEIAADRLFSNAAKAFREIPSCRIGGRILRGKRRTFRQRRVDPGADQRNQRRRTKCPPIVVVHLVVEATVALCIRSRHAANL